MLWDRVIQSASTIKIERVRKNETVTLGANESAYLTVTDSPNEAERETVPCSKIESGELKQ